MARIVLEGGAGYTGWISIISIKLRPVGDLILNGTISTCLKFLK